MQRTRLRSLVALSRAMAVLLTTLTAALFIASIIQASACSQKSSLVGPGGECFLATDCAPGLVCVEQANKSRVCSDDLSRVAGRPPPEGGVADAGEAGDAPADAPQPGDTGPQDTSTPPPDTFVPPQDTGAG